MASDPRFEELYRTEFRSVFATVYLLTGRASVAEEAAQEAFVRALERWSRLADKEWVAGWIITTAINVARRKLRRRPAVEPELRGGSEAEALLDLWRAVRSLPIRQRQAVVLRYRLDLSTRDAAAAMGCSEPAFRTLLSRAVAALRVVTGGEHDAGRTEAPLAP